MRDGGSAGRPADAGAAVVEFSLVAILIVTIFVAVLQVGVYVHVRNVIVASAQEGARFAANADVDSAAGGPRTLQLVAQALSESTADGLTCESGEQVGPDGVVMVVVHCEGAVGALLDVFGDLLPVDATGRAVKEGLA